MSTQDASTRAVEHLRAGGVIAFPTETVFGLGADAHNSQAIERIYTLKGRDAAKVMSLHVSDAHMARRYASEWPANAKQLTDRFWPGPLTIILRARADELSPRAVAPDHTVGLRCPDHPVTRNIIASFGRAIVGTSANRAGDPPCTTAHQVRDLFNDESLLVIDSHCANSGVASTVLSLADPLNPRVLREGTLTPRDLGLL